jgi:glycosyltransferase involved in cell wall biosynthesis/ubiquinone/menaquinone biosynthesis C-methylase UbiE
LDVVPFDIAEHDVVIKLKQKYFPPKKWDDNSVVIFCGHTSEEFSPKSVKTGIGGSEEAVINLSAELTKLGYKVTVYNNCGDNEGIYEGVEYLNWVKFNVKDEFDNFIAWRFNMFDVGILAKNKIVWLHDVPQEDQFTRGKSTFFDKVVVLSEYHKSLLPKDIPEEKIFVSTNGIVPEQFEGLEDIKREPHRIIYASSYNRGLETLLEMWKDIKKEVPDATLHIMYGWTVYDKFVNEGFVKDDGFKKKMVKLMMQDGVYEYGRIGHKELLKEYAKSSVFAYPCNYVGEINCIALTKAQACGCYCATNDFAVLGERNSCAVSNDKFKDKLIEFLKLENKLDNVQDRFIQENSWKSVAWGWKTRILKQDVPTLNRFYQDFIRDNVKVGETIVDIGCAEGHTFRDWAGVDKVTHVDLDDHGYLNNFIKADASKLPFKDKQFDVAVLGELLEHVIDPITVIKEAKRVAKRLVITVPNEYEWEGWQLPFHKIEDKERVSGKTRVQLLEKEGKIPIEKYHSDDNYEHLWHHRFYTAKTLAEDLEKAGITSYNLYKVRFLHWSHFGVIANV